MDGKSDGRSILVYESVRTCVYEGLELSSAEKLNSSTCRGIVESSLGRGAIELDRTRGFGEMEIPA